MPTCACARTVLRWARWTPSISPPLKNTRAEVERLKADPSYQVDETGLYPWTAEKVRFHVDVYQKYAGYYERNKKDAEKLAQAENIVIPEGFDPSAVKGILIESSQKLKTVRPRTLGQAARIPALRRRTYSFWPYI